MSSRANPVNLDSELTKVKQHLLKSEIARGVKAVGYLKNGASSCLKSKLGPCIVKNSTTAINHGKKVTDSIADWVTKGFVAGPFVTPPTENFRVNSILAVPQPGKLRICLNVSLPENNSLNSNIDKRKLERVTMSSAKLFSYSIIEAGKDCLMWKFDFEDAYKNIPIPPEEYYCQGFSWLGRYFVELKQIFGSAASVQNFDIVGNTLKTICLSTCKIPSKFVHRQLDDTPLVSPCKENWGDEFAAKYRNLCKQTGFRLAPNCPKFDKAFEKTNKGKVLGILFDTKTLSWRLPEEKRVKFSNISAKTILSKKSSLTNTQELMGCLNHVAQMNPFLSMFRFCLNKHLAKMISQKCSSTDLDQNAIDELRTWHGFFEDTTQWVPIAHPVSHPPQCTKVFVSDAAGFPNGTVWRGNLGCGVVGLGENSDTILTLQLWWPKKFITTEKDSLGRRFGNKTATLEQIGIVLPLITIPEKLSNQHIVFRTDNMACVYGHENGYMKNDACASILIKSVKLIGAYLGSTLYVSHAPRRSDWATSVADNLSRETTTGFLEKQMLARHSNQKIPSLFVEWLNNPCEDWALPFKLLDIVKQKIKC